MNKKVLSAILFSALFAGTGTFTSCIDTDEPAGIEELRGAKAELIRAKVAVEQADAAFTLAQAEVEKAKAAKKLAEAKIAEANAKIQEALAEAQEAATAEAKAYAEKMIAQYQNELKEAALSHQITMANLQTNLATAQRTYEMTLAAIEVAKQLLPTASQVELSSYQGAVDYWNMAVGGAKEDLAIKQKAYDKAVLVEKYLGQISTDSLKHIVDTAEVKLTAAKAELAKYENWLKEDVTTKDWRAEIDSLNEIVEALEKEHAKLELDTARAKNSLEYQALQKAVVDAAIPATVDSVYGYKYFGDEYATTLHVENNNTVLSASATATEEDAKKAEISAASLELIAKYNATTGVLEGGQLFVDKDSLAGFTTEVKAFLDTIAATAVADTTLKAKSDAAIKTWKDALAAYNVVDTTMQTKLDSANSKKTAWTATANKSPKKIDAYRKAMLDYLTVAVKNGAVLNTNKVLVPQDSVWVATGNTAEKKLSYALEDALTVLADTTKTYYAISQGVDFINAGTGTKELTVVDKATAKEKKFKFDLNVIKTDAKNTNTLYSELVAASNAAFGLANNYVKLGDYTTELEAMQNGYLHTQPSETDVKNLYTYQGVTDIANNALGAYGKYLYAEDTDIQTFAKNYPAIMANLEAAIAYWEATYKTLDAKLTAWDDAKDAADKALEEYEAEKIDFIDEKLAEIGLEQSRLQRIVTALANAVNTYLPEDLQAQSPDTYEVEAFMQTLEAIVASAKINVDYYTREVAAAKLAVELNETGSYTALATAKENLDNAVATLEAYQAELEKALANLAKVLEIITATVGE